MAVKPQEKKQKISNQLDQLKAITTIVVDTGDVEAISKLKPQDATTNPSLIFKVATMPKYASLVEDAISYGSSYSSDSAGQSLNARVSIVMVCICYLF